MNLSSDDRHLIVGILDELSSAIGFHRARVHLEKALQKRADQDQLNPLRKTMQIPCDTLAMTQARALFNISN